MDAYTIFYDILSNSEVQSKVTAIRPIVLNQDDKMPAIITRVISHNPTTSLQGDSGKLDQYRVQIDVWGNSLTNALDIANTVRKVVNDSDYAVRFDGQQETYEDDLNRYGIQMDFLIWVTH